MIERLGPLRRHLAVIGEFVATASGRVGPFAEQRLPSTDFVHSDIKSDNILWASPHSGDLGYATVTGVVDFDQASAGTRASDLVSLFKLCAESPDGPAAEYVPALLRQRVRSLVGQAGLIQLATHDAVFSALLRERLQCSPLEISVAFQGELGMLITIAAAADPPLQELEARLASDLT